MSLFGCEQPKIFLLYKDDPANLNTFFTLPYPARITHSWEPVRRQVKTRRGKIFTRHLGYRFTIEMTWMDVSNSDSTNMTKIANWTGGLLLLPHLDQPLIGFNVDAEFALTYPKDRIIDIDIVTMRFVSQDVQQIKDYDNLISVQEGYYLDDNQVVAGESNLVLNGDFAVWSVPGTPDNWDVTNADATNYVEEAVEKCRFVSDDSGVITIKPTVAILTLSATYTLWIDITAVVAGSLEYSKGGGTWADLPTDVANGHAIAFTAEGADFGIRMKAGAACDVTIDNVVLKFLGLTDMQLTFDEVTYS